MTGTVEISQKQQEDAEFAAARHEEIAAICWRKCPDCNGHGWPVQHRESDDGGPDYTFHIACGRCGGEGHIQLHDPWRVEALYDAADDARTEMGVWCYTRITKALALAIRGAVVFDVGWPVTVESETTKDQYYVVNCKGCECLDAAYQAPKINDLPHCKHQIAVYLVKAAEHKMFDQEPKHYGPGSDMLDGLISVQEAERREAQNV